MWRTIFSAIVFGSFISQFVADEMCQFPSQTCTDLGVELFSLNTDDVYTCAELCVGLDAPKCNVAKYNPSSLLCSLMSKSCDPSKLTYETDTDILVRSGDSFGACTAGGWGEWSDWAPCTKTCDGGTRVKDRTCLLVSRSSTCSGSTTDSQICNESPCPAAVVPVVGGWSSWTVFDVCTATCGGGTQTRTRTCDNPVPADGGENCVGDSRESQSCDESPCPVDGGLGDWTSWSDCSVTCGTGTRSKSRACTYPAPADGGEDCDGDLTASVACVEAPCPVDGGWNIWTVYDECTATCGGGTQTRTRTCDNPVAEHGGVTCTGDASGTKSCNEAPCPVDGGLSHWSSWAGCSATCGSGKQTRHRACDNPAPADGGEVCVDDLIESRSCDELSCQEASKAVIVKRTPAVDGGWGNWTVYDECTATCGGGTQTRTRTCDDPAPADGGLPCTGDASETQNCNGEPCPIDGGLSNWSDWDQCTASCDGGEQNRNRTCNNPEPENGGEDCTGDLTQTRICNGIPCPVDGGLSDWSGWDSCSATCGGGTQSRSRTCDNPSPVNGGEDCVGELSDSRSCNDLPCPVDGGWSDWTEFGTCSATCGGGIQTRTRTCDNPVAEHGGVTCAGDASETQACEEAPCPIDGGWSDWTEFGTCSATCGGGTQTRTRTCDNPVAEHGGVTCAGDASETQACEESPCPIDGGWSDWTEFGTCSATCGGGTQTRTRTCDNPIAEHGGVTCAGDASETQACEEAPCPVDGGWSDWSSWGSCSVTCGTGTQSRSRTCDNPPPGDGGTTCTGDSTASRQCTEAVCDCGACSDDGGSCHDSDGDGTTDSCVCPEGLCSTSFESGCDLFCAPVGDSCDPDATRPCWDEHAYCGFWGGGLSGLQLCRCEFSYVAVVTEGQPTRCQSKVSIHQDPSGCTACIENGGTCYDVDDDDVSDGCVCPITRATITEDCDTPLFSVECDASSMTVCYAHHDVTEHVNTFASLDDRSSVIYIQNHYSDLDCHLRKSDTDYCITFVHGVEPLCGLVEQDLKNHLSYSTLINVQKHAKLVAETDLCVYAYCRIEKTQQVSSGGVEVVGEKITGAEGVYSEAGLTLSVIDKHGNDLATTGIVMGDLMKMKISLSEDADGIFTSIRAEVCLVSDQYSLTREDVTTKALVVDGCPTEDGVLDAEQNFFPVEGNLGEIETGFFPAPKFGQTHYIFIHCAVRVCIDDEACVPKTCSSHRRSLTKRSMTPLAIQALSSPEFKHEVIVVRTRPAPEDLLNYIQQHEEERANIGRGKARGKQVGIWAAVLAVVIVTALIMVVLICSMSMWLLHRRRNTGVPSLIKSDRNSEEHDHLHSSAGLLPASISLSDNLW